MSVFAASRQISACVPVSSRTIASHPARGWLYAASPENNVALAGTVLLTPGMLLQGAVTPDDLGPGLTRMVVVIAFVFLAVYEVVPTALWGRTPGKAIVGTRVVRIGDDRPPGWKRAVLRWVLPALAFQIHVVGWIVAILLRAVLVLDPLRRSVPDRLAGTIVVRA